MKTRRDGEGSANDMSQMDAVGEASLLVAVVIAVLTVILIVLNYKLLRHTRTLISSSNQLTEATNNLSKTEVRPKVLMTQKPHYEGGQGGLVVDLANRGAGPALNVRLFAKVGDSPEFEAEKVVSGDRDLPAITGTKSFEFPSGSIVKSLRLQLRIRYLDILGNEFDEEVPDRMST